MDKNLYTWISKIKMLVFDFDGVMTDNKVIVDETGKESVVCHRGDGLGLEMLRKHAKIETLVISKEMNRVVAQRCRKLKMKYLHGIDDKLVTLKREVKRREMMLNDVCFVGNDINDIECMKEAGYSIAVKDSHVEVLKVADLITKNTGGNGAVREICDLIVSKQ